MTMLLLAWEREDAALPNDSLPTGHGARSSGHGARLRPGMVPRLHKVIGPRHLTDGGVDLVVQCRTMALQKCAFIRHAPNGEPDGKHLVVLDVTPPWSISRRCRARCTTPRIAANKDGKVRVSSSSWMEPLVAPVGEYLVLVNIDGQLRTYREKAIKSNQGQALP